MTNQYDHVNQQNSQKQFNSRMCFVCGIENPSGLHAHFYQIDETTCMGRFLPDNNHQGYPGRLHGGVMASMMDETLGRSVWGARGTDWGVTAELTIRYKAPVPLGQMLTVVGRVTEERRRFFAAEGELLLADGTVAATAEGKFVKLALDDILTETKGELDPNLELFIIPDEPARIESA
ncbi:MAG: PaaI family thioesterase [Caldilineales bacterium]|nr:PaaI family thioesterase [Caldilineales bacterium]